MSFASRVLQAMLHSAQTGAPGKDSPDADVALQLGEGADAPVLRAHRAVLSAISDVFAGIFSGHDDAVAAAGGAASGGVTTVSLSGFGRDAVAAALGVVYGGNLETITDWNVAAEVWEFAVEFRIREMARQARERCLGLVAEDNALGVLGVALKVRDEEAIDAVADFVAMPENFVAMVESEAFLAVDGPVVDALTVRPGKGKMVEGRVRTTVEKVWFDAIVRWLKVPTVVVVSEGEAPGDVGDVMGSGVAASDARGKVAAVVSGRHVPGESGQAIEAQAARKTETVYKRMRHVDHMLELVEFTRMTTEELAICAEEVTACHSARFPNCLIPLLAERCMDAESERDTLSSQKDELSKAFRSAVYAKNEAERAAIVSKERLDVVRAEASDLRLTMDVGGRALGGGGGASGLLTAGDSPALSDLRSGAQLFGSDGTDGRRGLDGGGDGENARSGWNDGYPAVSAPIAGGDGEGAPGAGAGEDGDEDEVDVDDDVDRENIGFSQAPAVDLKYAAAATAAARPRTPFYGNVQGTYGGGPGSQWYGGGGPRPGYPASSHQLGRRSPLDTQAAYRALEASPRAHERAWDLASKFRQKSMLRGAGAAVDPNYLQGLRVNYGAGPSGGPGGAVPQHQGVYQDRFSPQAAYPDRFVPQDAEGQREGRDRSSPVADEVIPRNDPDRVSPSTSGGTGSGRRRKRRSPRSGSPQQESDGGGNRLDVPAGDPMEYPQSRRSGSSKEESSQSRQTGSAESQATKSGRHGDSPHSNGEQSAHSSHQRGDRNSPPPEILVATADRPPDVSRVPRRARHEPHRPMSQTPPPTVTSS